jgi:hypothetical protein
MGLMEAREDNDTPEHESMETPAIEQNEDATGQEAPEEDVVGEESTEEEMMLAMAATDLLYADEMREQNIAMLQAGVPAISIPKLTATLIGAVDEKSNKQVPEEAIFPAAGLFLEEVIAFAGKAGIVIPPENEQDAVAVLVQELMQMYGITKEQVQEMVDDPEINKTLQGIAKGGGLLLANKDLMHQP